MIPNSNEQGNVKICAANSTTQVKKGNGLSVRFIPSVTGTLAIYDNAAGDTSGDVLLATTAVTVGIALHLGMLNLVGIVAVTAGGAAGSFVFN